MIGNLIGAGASLIGGLINRDSARRSANQTRDMALQQMQLQKDFAKSGIRWRVEDARKAGIHPLYALGANTTSYTPQSVSFGADTSLGNAFAQAGQDIGRAINSTRTGAERTDAFTKSVQAIQLTNAGLDTEAKRLQIELLKSQIQRSSGAQSSPPGPGDFVTPEDKIEENKPMNLGKRWYSNPAWSPSSAITDNYGEPGEWAYFGPKLIADLAYNIDHRGRQFGRYIWKDRYSGGSGW